MHDWTSCTLGEVAEILDYMRRPVNSKERAQRTGTVPYYGANGLQGWIDRPLFDEPLILLAEDGGNFDDYSIRPIAYRIDGPSWVNNHAHVIRAAPGTDQGFLFWSIVNRDIRRYIGGGTRTKLNQRELRSIVLELPPFPEQRRIADILNAIDDQINSAGMVIKKLEEIHSGLVDRLIRDSSPAAPPIALNDVACSDRGGMTIGPFGSSLVADDYKSSGWPVVFVRDIQKDGFRWRSDVYVSSEKAAELRAHVVRGNDVLMTKMGLPPCISAVYPMDMPPGVITADIIRIRPNMRIVDSRWLALAVNHEKFRQQVRKITGGITRPKVTLSDVRSLTVELPSLAVQRRIAAVVDESSKRLKATVSVREELIRLKQGLMADLLTGRVRVPVGGGAKEMAT